MTFSQKKSLNIFRLMRNLAQISFLNSNRATIQALDYEPVEFIPVSSSNLVIKHNQSFNSLMPCQSNYPNRILLSQVRNKSNIA